MTRSVPNTSGSSVSNTPWTWNTRPMGQTCLSVSVLEQLKLESAPDPTTACPLDVLGVQYNCFTPPEDLAWDDVTLELPTVQ